MDIIFGGDGLLIIMQEHHLPADVDPTLAVGA
jgi:hypothetical protein